MSKAPNGPTVKLHLQNCTTPVPFSTITPLVIKLNTHWPRLLELIVHTMEELHFPGNCLRGSRPILSFSPHFGSAPHLLVIKELLTHIFSVPKGARKSKPFIDHIMGFTIADGKIWIRCFQINETAIAKSEPIPETSTTKDHTSKKSKALKPERGETKISLVEIGPRFVLTPIVILESSFGGPVIYENKEFVSPNQIRSEIRLSKTGRYNERTAQGEERQGRKGVLGLRTGEGEHERDELSDAVLFAWFIMLLQARRFARPKTRPRIQQVCQKRFRLSLPYSSYLCRQKTYFTLRIQLTRPPLLSKLDKLWTSHHNNNHLTSQPLSI